MEATEGGNDLQKLFNPKGLNPSFDFKLKMMSANFRQSTHKQIYYTRR
jgi:hypothetical protein